MSLVRSLPLVLPSDQLRGTSPPAFERAAARSAAGDAVHRGVVRVASTIALHAVQRAAPPSARAAVVAALDVTEAWTRGDTDSQAVKRARSELFAALPLIERVTLDAVRKLLELAPTPAADRAPIDPHADEVVLRYAGLGAHYAASAALLTLDAVTSPKEATNVLAQAAGALAYQHVGLGAARSSELRGRVCEHASWEAEREGAPAGHSAGALALQLFHEWLGAHWKDVSDAERAYLFDFVNWAVPPN